MSEYMAERVRDWKIEECDLRMGIGAGVLTIMASLPLDKDYVVNYHRDIEMFMENLAKGPATVLPSAEVNKLLDENTWLRNKLNDTQDKLDEIRSAVKVLSNLEGKE